MERSVLAFAVPAVVAALLGGGVVRRRARVLTPHLGFVNDAAFGKFGPGVVENLLAWLWGDPPARVLLS